MPGIDAGVEKQFRQSSLPMSGTLGSDAGSLRVHKPDREAISYAWLHEIWQTAAKKAGHSRAVGPVMIQQQISGLKIY